MPPPLTRADPDPEARREAFAIPDELRSFPSGHTNSIVALTAASGTNRDDARVSERSAHLGRWGSCLASPRGTVGSRATSTISRTALPARRWECSPSARASRCSSILPSPHTRNRRRLLDGATGSRPSQAGGWSAVRLAVLTSAGLRAARWGGLRLPTRGCRLRGMSIGVPCSAIFSARSFVLSPERSYIAGWPAA